MKKMALVLLMCTALICGAAQAGEAAPYSIVFDENPTTGYEWTFAVSDDSILAVADGGYTLSDGAENMAGAGGTHAWSVSGLKEGQASVTLTYARSWESDPSDPVVTYTFAVDAGLNVTVASAEGLPEQYMPGKAVIRLLENPTTGYEWTVEAQPEGIVSLESDEFTADAAAEGMVGAGGVHTWIFNAGGEGTVVLTFRYARSFEPNEQPAATVTFTYQVDAESRVTQMGIDGDYEQYDPAAQPSL